MNLVIPAWSLGNSFTSFHPDLEVLHWTLMYGHFLGLGFWGPACPCLEGYLLLQAELTVSYFKHPVVGLSGRNQLLTRVWSGPGSLLNSRLEPAATAQPHPQDFSPSLEPVFYFVSFLIQPNLTLHQNFSTHSSQSWVAATRSFPESLEVGWGLVARKLSA